MSWQMIAAMAGSAVYGLLYLVVGFAALRNQKLNPALNMLLAFFGAIVAISALLTNFHASNALGVLAAGLLGIHWITFRNGLMLHDGKVKWSHHLVRLAISLVLLGLAYWAKLVA